MEPLQHINIIERTRHLRTVGLATIRSCGDRRGRGTAAYLRRSGRGAGIRQRLLCRGGGGYGVPRCGLRGPSSAGNGDGGCGQHARGQNRPGNSRSSRDLRQRIAAQRRFRRARAEMSYRQRLARVGGRARFALSTPTSAGSGRADGGAPKFICGLATDEGSGLHVFFSSRPQPAKRWLFCRLGLDEGLL
jgi:hypothetical protein